MRKKHLLCFNYFAVLLIGLLFFLPQKTTAQYPYTIKISYPEQLPTPIIYDMIADKKGYIWLGTDKGLIKFNGIDFKLIPFTKTTLNSVSYLQQDSAGVIWCRNFYKELFFLKNDSLHRYYPRDSTLLYSNSLNGVISTGKYLWISNSDKISKINIETGKTLKEFKNAENFIDPIYGFCYSEGKIFALTSYSNVWIIENDVLNKRENNDIEKLNFLPTFITEGKRFLAVSKTIYKRNVLLYDENNTRIKLPLFDLPANINLFEITKTDKLYWICTQQGAWLWNPLTGKTKLVFPNLSITKIIKDYQGNFWISTLDNGLYICQSLENSVYTFSENPTQNNITRLDFIGENKIAFGTSTGELISLNPQNITVSKTKQNNNLEIELLQYDKIRNQTYFDIGILTKNNKVINTMDLGKRIAFDPWGNIISIQHNRAMIMGNRKIPGDSKIISTNSLYEKFPYIRVGFKSSLVEKKSPFLKLDLVKSIREVRSTYVLTDNLKKKFWISYEDDLYEYHYDGTIKIIKTPDGKPVIGKHIFLQNDSMLLVSSSTNGLYVIENGKVIKQYRIENGLHSNQVKKSQFFNGKYWLATGEGLEVIDPEKGLIYDLLTINGLDKMIINDFEIKNGFIWMATHHGVLKLTTTFSENKKHIIFSSLKLNVNDDYLSENSKLKWNQNNIEFEMDVINFKGPSKFDYHYRIKEIDESWESANGYSKSIRFNALPPGNYTFEVYAEGVYKQYKSDLKTFHFSIAKPFWLTTWFMLSILFVIGYFIYLFFRWRIRNIRKSHKRNELFLQSRLMALRAQMNPHFIFNILNTVQGLIYNNQKKEAGNVLSNFSDLMRKTLIASEKQNVTINEELNNLELYLELEKARFDEDFEYHIVKNITHHRDAVIPSLLIQPFVENAIKHGLLHKKGLKTLNIEFSELENSLKISIDDNGIGRQRSAEINQKNKSKPESFATKNIDNRIQIFNEMNKEKIELSITDKIEGGKSNGTLVELVIPFIL